MSLAVPFAATFAVVPAMPAFAQQNKPLNVVYIMSDDHSYQTISCYDGRYIKTPNIDRIAQDGVRFTNSFVTNSISGPSRILQPYIYCPRRKSNS